MTLEAPDRSSFDQSVPDEAIQEHLQRVLTSRFFSTSKRSSSMLQYIVKHALQGDTLSLKERTIGTEVFDRQADYDTSSDPVVRNAAAEIRKRLAQYYEENSSELIKLGLPSGSYVPIFSTHQPSTTASQETTLAPTVTTRRISRRKQISMILVVGLIVIGSLLAALYRFTDLPIEDKFWSPWMSGDISTLLCLGNIDTFKLPPPSPPASDSLNAAIGVAEKDRVGLAEVEAVHAISELLTARKTHVIVRSSPSTGFDDIREHPSVLVGGRTNQWAMRAMSELPLRLIQGSEPGKVEIYDAHARTVLWNDNLQVPVEQRKVAYGIVARFHDPSTDQFTLVLAGLGPNGTIAAVQFVTNAAYLKQLLTQAPRGWEKRNLEIILEAQLIDGKQGPPRILKTTSW